MKIKKVFKYGTGDIIPEGATYLTTKTQTEILIDENTRYVRREKCWLVWHYFLVEVEVKT